MYFDDTIFQRVSKNHLLIDVELKKISKMLEYEYACVSGVPIFAFPVAYATHDFLDELDIQSDVVRLYPVKPGSKLFQESTTFVLKRTELLIVDTSKDKKTNLRQPKYCMATSYEWFKINSINKDSIETMVQVVPGLDAKPMY